jgi:serine/threonine protein kinase
MSLEGYQLGHYRLQGLIGSGGMGEIYLAQDTHIPRQVAVKVLRTEKDFSSDSSTAQEAERLFEREMKAISLLDHPHILPIFDYGTERIGNIAPTYLVMPYRPEGSLLDWLRQQDSTTPLDPSKVIHILLQAADALQHAHERQIIHQDIKPANFLIRVRNSAADVPDVLLADFGIAKFIDASSSSTSQSVRGTPTYMPPEQWESQPVPASDQYALAVMAFLMLTGHTPFRGSPGQVMHQHFNVSPPMPSTINPRLSPAVDAVLLRALAKQPHERFPSVLQFAQALQQALQSREFQQAPFASSQLPQAGGYPLAKPAGQFIAPVSSPGTLQPGIFTNGLSHSQPASRPLSSPTPPTPITPSSSLSTQDTPQQMVAPVDVPFNAQTSVPPAQYMQPRSVLPRSQKLLLIAAVALVVLGSSGIAIFSVLGRSVGSSQQATVTTAQKHARLTTMQTTTAIAQTNMTATAQAFKATTTTALANDPYLNGKGTLLVNDPLSTPDYWRMQTSGSWGGTCVFKNGAYHVTQGVTGRTFGCNAASLQGSNFIYEVQATIVSGDCGGIRFRYNPTTHLGYTFRFCHDGNVSLVEQHSILYGSVSSPVRQGYNQSNIIATVARGNQIRLYINKQPIITMTDGAFSRGVFALDVQDNTQPSDVAFNNAKIWQL